MGAQDNVWAVIRALVGQANVLTIPRLFVDLACSLETALFLSQLLYWSDKGKRPDGFIYKSRREWSEELALSEYAIRKATKKLKTMGLLETKLHRASGAPTLHYRLDQEALLNALLRFVEINKSDLSESTNQICRDQQISNILNLCTNGKTLICAKFQHDLDSFSRLV